MKAEFDQRVLQCAATFASADVARPIIHTVAIYSADLIVATDSYRLGIIGRPGEMPGDLVRRGMATKDTKARLLDVDDITKAAKVADKPNHLNAPTWKIGLDDITLPDGTVITAPHVDGEFPHVSGLLADVEPAPVGGIGFDPRKLAAFLKSTQMLYGSTANRVANSMPPVVFHGAETAAKPSYWSVSALAATLVVLLMPVRTSAAWEQATADEVAA